MKKQLLSERAEKNKHVEDKNKVQIHEYMKERKKNEDMVRMLRNLEVKLEEVTVQKVVHTCNL